ncbi:undecaprenyl-diphosphate phosphatase [Planktothrix agardhii]|jgi:undecaprenyl-diphosphatase|uniref:Undecaprenyl-diphosphatase n=2 Tax=Planktothrix agardhii TaxID=1160 RepID=A0A073CCG5_PLAA1|nr:undecaprenyl-diphosphate phosphatase [Planktothrix agardhii]KEI66019.1 BacA [Planktothrix agardhii NIVA-CYA 126/8]MCF3591059.1 undecaprenyl-diphosphate phosphatase [Planktothrix agardhii 1029]MCF3619476.1 undecaprenyl-diphosphate phosphatase [Planktothrix agardhii 1030]MEA5560923.1 undecaprenyl-diphosphate phosphatase [Planktothrix agardhii UHCC 0887]CAD5922838.1 Undecaprenyl-diphosphatase [Planktothrix agardhii]
MLSIIDSSEYLTDLFRNLAINNLLIQAPSAPEVATQINILQAFFLGLIQGLTEFLPISSTAHLKVIPVILGWGDPGIEFTAIIQLGSIAAVVWFFWQDLTQVVTGSWRAIQKKDYDSVDFRLALGIGLGTIPIVFFGLLIKIFIPDYDNSPLRSMEVIATASIVMAFLLGLAEKIGTRKRNFEHLTPRDGILMGLAQTLALIPGVSRSGSTITAGLFLGLERATAARFSFLLGIPAITLAGIVELKAVLVDGIGNIQIFPLLVGLISATIFSYLSIAWLIRYLQSKSTWIFVWYRLAFGVAILTALWGGVLNNI